MLCTHAALQLSRGWRLAAAVLFVGMLGATAHSQMGAGVNGARGEWTTSSASAGRDAWQRGPSRLSPETAGGLHLLWKAKLASKTMGMQSFREPLIVAGVGTARGERTLTLLAGAANDVFALDAASGEVVWSKKLRWESAKPEEPGEGQGFICTNALSATPVVSPAGAGTRRLYVLASDGYLHTMDLATGEEPDRPIKVLSLPYGKAYGLNLVGDVIYTITGQGCGGVPNGLYAVNLKTRAVTVSAPPQAGLWGGRARRWGRMGRSTSSRAMDRTMSRRGRSRLRSRRSRLRTTG